MDLVIISTGIVITLLEETLAQFSKNIGKNSAFWAKMKNLNRKRI